MRLNSLERIARKACATYVFLFTGDEILSLEKNSNFRHGDEVLFSRNLVYSQIEFLLGSPWKVLKKLFETKQATIACCCQILLFIALTRSSHFFVSLARLVNVLWRNKYLMSFNIAKNPQERPLQENKN